LALTLGEFEEFDYEDDESILIIKKAHRVNRFDALVLILKAISYLQFERNNFNCFYNYFFNFS